ncbi:nicotinamide N-methyltransferase-like [Phyllobates terribilis]|uniref:nicotinamide N-methyltransferase-like n=1 Tax=Phyllobates terribilis TaxID=111132 RepID=UPI003CCB5768
MNTRSHHVFNNIYKLVPTDYIKAMSAGAEVVTPAVIQDYTMDSSTHKLYHDDGFDSRQFLDHYFSDKSAKVFEEDAQFFPIESLKKTFSEGLIKGDLLIDISVGSTIHHLYAAGDYFKHIIVLKARDRCILELKRWVDERTGAFSWCHAAKFHGNVEGESYQLENTEQKVRSALQHVVKCNLKKENMTDPIVLPPADCIISAWLLDAICKDHDDYISNVRKFSKLIKPGGYIILIGNIDATYYTVGKHIYHLLKYDEDFVRKALAGEGFIVDSCNVTERRAVPHELIDYRAIIITVAHKEK